MPRLPRLASSIVLAALAASAAAQTSDGNDADPFDSLRAVAKAKFEAMHRTPTERAQALLETARIGLQASFRMFQDGKITADFLSEWGPRLLEAELGVLEKDADAGPPYENRWRGTLELEKIAEVKRLANKLGAGDVAAARWERLDAELAWLRHRGSGDKKTPLGSDPFADFATRDFPRDAAKAVEADPRQLARERLTAARVTLLGRMQEFQAGKITPDWPLTSVKRVFDSELLLLDKGADPTSLLEWRWKTLWRIEKTAEDKSHTGRIGAADVAQCRSVLLAAVIAWRQARQEKEKPGSRKRIASNEYDDEADWARVKEEASRADIGRLLRDRLQAASEECHGRRRQFQEGRITANVVLEASLRLLDAERAVAAGPKEEAAAVERYWRRGLEADAASEKKLTQGKISLPEVMKVRYARLQAEIWMATGLPVEQHGHAGDLP